MVINKKARKNQKFVEVLFVETDFVEALFLGTVFVEVLFAVSIISSHVITEYSIRLPTFLLFSQLHVA